MQDARCLVNATVRPVSGSIRVLSESTPRGYAIPPPARSLWLLLAPGLLFWYQGPHPPAMDTGVRRGSEHHGPVASVCKLVQSLRSLGALRPSDSSSVHGCGAGRDATPWAAAWPCCYWRCSSRRQRPPPSRSFPRTSAASTTPHPAPPCEWIPCPWQTPHPQTRPRTSSTHAEMPLRVPSRSNVG